MNSVADNGSGQVLPVLDWGISASMTCILDAHCQTISYFTLDKILQISVLNN